ncbi:MAG: hypothetical protein KatS3mg035_0590 [Bacteroidia bacterium]|nr:MAG: hypothetical protein KatS3mg035_0590 [Bacteroidia bacterium]
MENSDNRNIDFHHFQKLIKKVIHLKNSYLELVDENRFLKIQLEERDKELEKKKNYIKNLEEQLEIRNLALKSSISENQQQYINELLKEIDACLRLLENT